MNISPNALRVIKTNIPPPTTLSTEMLPSTVVSSSPSLIPFPFLTPISLHKNINTNTLFHTKTTLSLTRLPKRNCCSYSKVQQSSSSSKEDVEEEEEEYQVLACVKSVYNDIVILETAKSRVLLLDSTGNVHSMLNKEHKWTGSYWDEFASLPPIVPEGPIAIFGLGGGTAAHLMLDLWPSLQLEGWEIDEILIDKAREHFGLCDLENHSQAGGILHVHIGDALCPSGNDSQRYAGIIVDLFAEGSVLAQLHEVKTWLKMKDRLIARGRIMVNCGGVSRESNSAHIKVDTKSFEDACFNNSVIKALSQAFPGQLSWKRMPETKGANYLALTGPIPDLTSWSAAVPHNLSGSVLEWIHCDPNS